MSDTDQYHTHTQLWYWLLIIAFILLLTALIIWFIVGTTSNVWFWSALILGIGFLLVGIILALTTQHNYIQENVVSATKTRQVYTQPTCGTSTCSLAPPPPPSCSMYSTAPTYLPANTYTGFIPNANSYTVFPSYSTPAPVPTTVYGSVPVRSVANFQQVSNPVTIGSFANRPLV